ncbi:hypothetical protein E1263_15425 [Kribbella antibiotica]|uniref:Universal stress protein n=1 Tax=Kribbella antibiotica TaxID=190195 RepID=A0A4R4ZKL1_9ACTN|nr:hypothetical protein [Kribbella antibiotica]TDD59308.1 hypothetical protein E1263_15425 [Kribbella antibiotica]
MTYDVVVLIEREMSEGDARRVAALHARHEEAVNYHLLVSSHPERGFGGPMALLGTTFADVAGMTGPPGSAPAGTALATLADPDLDMASVIEHSARQLRGASRYPVHVSITHGEVLLALKTLVMRSGGQEVVVVAWPETAASFLCSDWAAKARKILKVPRVRILEHDS